MKAHLIYKVGDLVVLRAEGRIGEVAGTMSIEGELLYIINFYDRVDPRLPLVTHKQNELGRVIR
jgi:hypothetical protein